MEPNQIPPDLATTGISTNLGSMPSQIPPGAKITAVLFYLLSIPYVIFGVLSTFGLSFIASVVGSLGFGSGLFWPSIALIVWGILSFFAGKGLWSGRQWGRVLAVTMSGLYIIFGIIVLIKLGSLGISYFSLLINIVVILYLILSKKVAAAFQGGGSVGISVVLVVLSVAIYSTINYPTLISPQAQTLSQPANSVNNNTATSSMSLPITASSSPSQGTQTYTNSTYGFQITIPPDSTVQENVASSINTHLVFLEGNNSFMVMSIVNESPIQDTLNDLVNEHLRVEGSIQQIDTTIAGQPAIHTPTTTADGQVSDDYFILHNKYYFFDIIRERNISSDQFDTIVQSLSFTQ